MTHKVRSTLIELKMKSHFNETRSGINRQQGQRSVKRPFCLWGNCSKFANIFPIKLPLYINLLYVSSLNCCIAVEMAFN